MIRKRLSLISLLLGLAPAALRAEGSAGPTGILTRVYGAVQLIGPGVQRTPLARLWQVIRTGVTVRVPEGGAVGIVCSNLRFVRLQGPESWSLTEQGCTAGAELTPGEYALIAPQAGRFRILRGFLTLKRELRLVEERNSRIPMVLRPLNQVHSPRPTVSWSRVPSAVEYRVVWDGRHIRGYDDILRAEDIVCSPEPGGVEACVQPWPPDRPDLPPDDTFNLRIAAYGGGRDSWHWTEPVEVHTQGLSASVGLKSRLQSLETLGFEGPALQVARAGLFAGEELYSDAAEAYRLALTQAPSAELRVTLADIYLTAGLYPLAGALYREELAQGSPTIRAAAAFGLGRLEYAYGHYPEAAAAFRQAREAYAKLGLGEEAAAALRAEERAAATPPKPKK